MALADSSDALADVGTSTVDKFPKFTWWTVTYELFCILAVAVVVAMNSVSKYRVAVCHLAG